MEKKEVILSVKIESADAVTGMKELEERIEATKNRQKELDQQYKDGKISLSQYNAETQKNNKTLKESEGAYKSLTKATDDQGESINSLRKRNSELTKERNALNLQTKEGQKRLKEINIELDANNEKIRQNVSGLEKQKINIGNYASALNGISPAIGGFVQGIEAQTKAAMTFIATPLGATIAALGVAFAALQNYFKTTGEGEDDLARKTEALNAIWKEYTDLINVSVGYVLNAEGSFDKLEKKIGILAYTAAVATAPMKGLIWVLQQVGDALASDEAIAYANKLDETADAAGRLSVKQAQVRNEIDLLLLKAKEKGISDVERAKFLEEALQKEIALTKELNNIKNVELSLVLKNIELNNNQAISALDLADKTFASITEKNKYIAEQLLLGGSITDDERKKVQDALIAIEESRGRSLEIQQKIQNKQTAIEEKAAAQAEKRREQEEKANQKRDEMLQKIASAELKAQDEMDAYFAKLEADSDKRIDLALNTGIQELEVDAQIKEQLIKQEDEFNFKIEQERKALNAKQIADDKKVTAAKITSVREGLQQAQSLFKENTVAYKALSVAQALMDTYASVARALKDYPFPFNAVVGGINLASGLATVNQIKGTFAEGGYTGAGGKYEPAGIVHKGEVVFSQADVAALGGANIVDRMRPTFKGYANGGIVTSGTTMPIDRQFQLANAFKNMPPVIASWKEATEVRNRVEFKESLITV